MRGAAGGADKQRNSTRMPAAGVPAATFNTCVVSLPIELRAEEHYSTFAAPFVHNQSH
jgi:hypothetical protein